MNLYPNFSKDEIAILGGACIDEIAYWKRLNYTGMTISKGIIESKGEIPQNSNNPIDKIAYQAADEAKTTYVKRYSELLHKIEENEKEYSDEDIHWLKIMCQEIIPSIARHTVVKKQIDGTVTAKHALAILQVGFTELAEHFMKSYQVLADRLGAMDTIPGEGMKQPQGFRFRVK